MKQAVWNGKKVDAGPEAPARALCPACGAAVLLRRRKVIGGEIWYWRHESGANPDCPARNNGPVKTGRNNDEL